MLIFLIRNRDRDKNRGKNIKMASQILQDIFVRSKQQTSKLHYFLSELQPLSVNR
jgi:hypothetical protein